MVAKPSINQFLSDVVDCLSILPYAREHMDLTKERITIRCNDGILSLYVEEQTPYLEPCGGNDNTGG